MIAWLHEYDQTLGRTVRDVDIALRSRLRKRHAAFEDLKAAELCTETYTDRVGQPPSARLRLLHEHILDACQHFFDGADILSTFVSDGGVSRTEFVIEVRRFGEDWARARGLLLRAGAQLASLAPPNARRLRIRAGPSGQSRIDPRLGRVAATLANGPAEVRCWSKDEWPGLLAETERWQKHRIPPDTLGFVTFGDHRINLAGDICAQLDVVRVVDVRTAFAVGALSHEVMHVRGIADETAATCEGLKRIRAVAASLGYSRRQGRALANGFRSLVIPSLPAAYRARPC